MRNDYSVLAKLELCDKPIGVKYGFFRPEGIEPLEKDAAMSLCEMMRLCQREDRAFYFYISHNPSGVPIHIDSFALH